MEKFFLDWMLKWAVKMAHKRFSPFVIFVCGSQGKSQIRQKIFEALEEKNPISVRQNERKKSTEETLPLVIFDLLEGRNFSEWISVIVESFQTVVFAKSFPSIWILEIDLQKQGDAEKILSMLHPDITLFSSLVPRTLDDENFLHMLQQEFLQIAGSSFRNIANANDKRVTQMIDSLISLKKNTHLIDMKNLEETTTEVMKTLEATQIHFHKH